MSNSHLGLPEDSIERCPSCGRWSRHPDTPPSAVSSPLDDSSTSDEQTFSTAPNGAPESNNGFRLGPQRAEMFNSDNGEASPWAPKALLTLDGGGIRGYSSLLILQRLTDTIRKLETESELDVCENSASYPWHSNSDSIISEHICSGQGSAFKLRHYFDYMAGTSTGGLSAIMLSRLGMSVDEALSQYEIVGNGVFGKPRSLISSWNGIRLPKYRSHDMEDALKKVIENGTSLAYEPTRNDGGELLLRNKNAHACRTMVLSHGSDEMRAVVMTYIFRSYNHLRPTHQDESFTSEHLNLGEASRVKLWEVARATSAAPSYFAPAIIGIGRFVHQDGGLGANNPTEKAFNECRQMHQHKAPFITISVGTGIQDYTPQNLPRSKASALLKNPRNLFGALKAMENFATDTQPVHEHMREKVHDMKEHYDEPSDHAPYYFRFNVEGIKDVALDEWLPAHGGEQTRTKLKEATDRYLERTDIKKNMLECATRLVQLRRQRAITERWERFATSIVYRCPEPHCNLDGFDNARNDLRTHGRTSHGKVLRERLPLMCLDAGCNRGKLLGNEKETFILDHLKKEHGFKAPRLVTAAELEAWLDVGRTSPQQAAQAWANRQQPNGNAQARAVGNLNLETRSLA